MNLKLAALKPQHAAIAPYLRQSDLQELDAMTGLPPAVAVAYSIAHSEKGYAAEIDGKPIAIFGVADGLIWLVATDDINNYPITFYRLSKKIFQKLKSGYIQLSNYVDTRNKLSLKWLKWLGFKIDPPMKINNGIFHFVHWEEEDF